MAIVQEFKPPAMRGSVVKTAFDIIIVTPFGKIAGSPVNGVLMTPIGTLMVSASAARVPTIQEHTRCAGPPDAEKRSGHCVSVVRWGAHDAFLTPVFRLNLFNRDS